MARYAYHQLDANQREIVAALKAGGCSVVSIGRPVDLAVGKAGKTYLVEVKRPKGKLAASQVRFIEGWRGHVAVLRTVEEALLFVKHLP